MGFRLAWFTSFEPLVRMDSSLSPSHDLHKEAWLKDHIGGNPKWSSGVRVRKCRASRNGLGFGGGENMYLLRLLSLGICRDLLVCPPSMNLCVARVGWCHRLDLLTALNMSWHPYVRSSLSFSVCNRWAWRHTRHPGTKRLLTRVCTDLPEYGRA